MIETSPESTGCLASVEHVSVRFGGIVALDDVSFKLQVGRITSLIGPNGAGKTTLFNCICRLYTPSGGDIRFKGASILSLGAHRIAALGIGRTFQNVALFPTMTALENVMVGAHSRTRSNYVTDILRTLRVKHQEEELRAEVRRLLAELDLSGVADSTVANLPFGTRKRVEIARALASKPQLLLLDEPAGGLNHEEVAELGQLIARLRDAHGVTVLLVEHHIGLVMSVSERIVVLNFGRVLAEGSPAEIQRHPEVLRAYLGDMKP